MITVEKLNVVYQVPEEEVQSYLDEGFTVTGEAPVAKTKPSGTKKTDDKKDAAKDAPKSKEDAEAALAALVN